MPKIITKFGKFIYNCIPMVMCPSGYIFQAKLDKLLGDIKEVKTYIDDILVLRKESLRKHINKIRVIFARPSASGLKLNAPKCSFRLK